MAQFRSPWQITCCNPFNKLHHVAKKNQLRIVTKKICEKLPSVLPGDKICDDCRKKVAAESKRQSLPQEHSNSASESDVVSADEEYDYPLAIQAVANEYLDVIGETPLTRRKLHSKTYSTQKQESITTMMQKAVIGGVHESTDDGEMISQLKEKYLTANRSEKVQILTTLPKSWSIKKVECEFGASNFMVRKAKQLVKEKGIMSTPNPKPGRTLSQRSVDLVTSFYENDEHSRLMPGKRKEGLYFSEEGRRTSQYPKETGSFHFKRAVLLF